MSREHGCEREDIVQLNVFGLGRVVPLDLAGKSGRIVELGFVRELGRLGVGWGTVRLTQ